nr:hypothetical protein [Tanacetum cinerariifolium]
MMSSLFVTNNFKKVMNKGGVATEEKEAIELQPQKKGTKLSDFMARKKDTTTSCIPTILLLSHILVFEDKTRASHKLFAFGLERYEALVGQLDMPLISLIGVNSRINTIITSLKALDDSFSSRNHVRNFLRALPTKWRPKFTVVLEKDLEISKSKKEKYKSLALKARKVLSEEEKTYSDNDDEKYALA